MKKKATIAISCVLALALIFSVFLFPKKEKLSHTVFTGMGTVIDIKLFKEDDGETEELSKIFSEIENTSSVRLDKSEATLLNDSGKTENAMLLEEAGICLDVFAKSDGAFDFTVGGISSLWNIGFENARVPSEGEIAEALQKVGSEKVLLDKKEILISEGQKVDFGAVAKGFALDKAKEFLLKTEVEKAVISVGGSLLFYGEKEGGWTVGVRSPFDKTKNACVFTIKDGFVSTSGSYERYFEENGKVYHHILDPKTGYPAESELVSVTVIAESGALSDALSTACFVLGEEKSKALLCQYDAKAVFIDKDGKITTFGNVAVEK